MPKESKRQREDNLMYELGQGEMRCIHTDRKIHKIIPSG